MGGMLRVLRSHLGEMTEYVVTAQNALDDAATLAEKLYGLVAGRDIMASSLFYAGGLCAALFARIFGLGAAVFVFLLWLLRPPRLRATGGSFGVRAFVYNIPARSSTA